MLQSGKGRAAVLAWDGSAQRSILGRSKHASVIHLSVWTSSTDRPPATRRWVERPVGHLHVINHLLVDARSRIVKTTATHSIAAAAASFLSIQSRHRRSIHNTLCQLVPMSVNHFSVDSPLVTTTQRVLIKTGPIQKLLQCSKNLSAWSMTF